MSVKKRIGITIRMQSIVTKIRKSKAYRTLEYFDKTFCFTRSIPSWVEMCFFKLEAKIDGVMRRIQALIMNGKLSHRQKWLFYHLIRKFLPLFLKARRFIF